MSSVHALTLRHIIPAGALVLVGRSFAIDQGSGEIGNSTQCLISLRRNFSASPKGVRQCRPQASLLQLLARKQDGLPENLHGNHYSIHGSHTGITQPVVGLDSVLQRFLSSIVCQIFESGFPYFDHDPSPILENYGRMVVLVVI
jgi:hypothetical protein